MEIYNRKFGNKISVYKIILNNMQYNSTLIFMNIIISNTLGNFNYSEQLFDGLNIFEKSLTK